MSKRLKLCGAAYCRLKTNIEENLTKCADSIDAYVKNAGKGKSMHVMTKVVNGHKKQDP